jgi:ferredoxin
VEEGCIAISFIEDDNPKYFPPMARKANKEEAMAHLTRAAEAGLVHQSHNVESSHHFICNCCSCCCGLLRGVKEFKAPYMMLKSNYMAQIDEDLCTACGTCAEERCQFDAIAEGEAFYTVDPDQCVGCGVCIETCPTEAITLDLRPENQQTQPLKNLEEFAQKRSMSRSS